MEFRQWYERNKGFFTPLVGLLAVFLISLAVLPLSVVLINKDALKAFIEAEATLLGFFGLVVVYVLNSLDMRIDRFEEQRFRFEVEQKNEKEASKRKDSRDRTRELKRSFINRSIVIGSMMVASMLICIIILAGVDAILDPQFPRALFSAVALFGGIAILMFLESTVFLFGIFRDYARAS